jgi:hypothetical protein
MVKVKISGLEFSKAGDKYLGRSYQEMDCQAFVEKCMADVGYRRDLGGSNSWYRECKLHGWAGSPEECVKEFGSVPKGALLFILEPVGPKTPGKFRDDGVGDATHMGIVTGRGDGAIHSSRSRGCVATSKFAGKTIPNGGWNRVGLLPVFDYGVRRSLDSLRALGYRPFSAENEHTGSFSGRDEPRDDTESSRNDPFGQHVFDNVEEITDKEEKMPENRYVTGPNNETVNLRKRPDGALIDRIRSGETAEILTEGPVWSKVRIGSKVGYMMTQFLVSGDEDTAEPDLLAEIYEALRELCDRIENVIAKE